MPNLLQKASIVLTPTAYDDGKVLCAKPSEAPYGDFDFSRNSAATRVNAQGLVENVQILSSNLVQNGDFSELGAEEVSNGSFSQQGSELLSQPVNLVTDFQNNSGGVIVDADTFTTSGGTLDGIRKTNFLTVGKYYKLVIEGDTTSSGFSIGSLGAGGNEYGTGFGTHYFECIHSGLWIRQQTSGTTNITSFSVVEVGQDWDFVGGAEITEQGARINNTITGANAYIIQSNSNFTIGKSFVLEYDVVETNGKTLVVAQTSNLVLNTSTIGNNRKLYFNWDRANTSFIIKRLSAGTDVTITNISVKEVGQDWVLNSATIELGKLTLNSVGGAMTYASQSGLTLVANTSYLISINATRISGDTNLAFGSGGVNNVAGSPIISTSGIQSYNFTPTTNLSGFGLKRNAGGSGAVWEITNISVIEITDDTNLPRINYEGFSYQDALGSEEIVNGDFSDGSTGWNKSAQVTIENGVANIISNDGSLQSLTQSNVTTVGKSYVLTYNVVSNNGGELKYSNLGSINSTVGTHSFYFVATFTSASIARNSGVTDITIDNVSVKEYLGQEVVPDSGCGSWLFEPQSTNLVTYSEDLSTYTTTATTVSVTTEKSPIKSVTPFLITETAVSNQHYIGGNSISLSGNNTIYCFVKNVSLGRYFKIWGFGLGGANEAVIFDTNTETIYEPPTSTLYVGGSAKLKDYGNGWFRCSITINTTTTSFLAAGLINTVTGFGNNYYLGDITKSVLMTGIQIENQSYATSYIPTSGSTVTRNQDVCTNGGTGTGLINSTEGVLYTEIAALSNDGTTRRISLTDGSISNRVSLEFDEITNRIVAFITSAGISQILIYNAPNLLQFNKVAIKYKQNDFALWFNGVEVVIDTFGNAPIGLNEITFDTGNGNGLFYGKTKALAVWKEALTDQELADLTYPTPTDPTFSLDFDTIAEQFTFARGSEATYVDAQGLIQSTNEIGPELITNGDFSNGSTDWVLNDWTVANGKASLLNGSSFINQNNILEVGKTYKIQYTISDYVSGTVRWRNAGVNGSTNASNGVVTDYITVGGTGFSIQGYNNFTGSIDNISAKEYTTATNTPRLDYSTGAEAFLLEPQSTNLIPYSEDYNSGNWYEYNETSATIDASQINPSGANGSYKIESLSGLGRFGLSAITVAPSTNYTLSFYVKNIDATLLKVILGSGASPGSYTYTSEVNTSDWSRVSVNFTTGAVTSMQIQFLRDLPIGESAYIWGAQLEQQSYATSYIPSNGSQTTRNQETCINATPETNSEEGTLYFEGSVLANTSTFEVISLSDGSLSNILGLVYRNVLNQFSAVVKSGGSTSLSKTITLADATDTIKVAISYKLNDFKFYLNGVLIIADTSGNTPIGLNTLNFADGNGTSNKFFGNTKDLQVYTKALSDAELIKLTT